MEVTLENERGPGEKENQGSLVMQTMGGGGGANEVECARAQL
jgi:hypothetical protein